MYAASSSWDWMTHAANLKHRLKFQFLNITLVSVFRLFSHRRFWWLLYFQVWRRPDANKISITSPYHRLVDWTGMFRGRGRGPEKEIIQLGKIHVRWRRLPKADEDSFTYDMCVIFFDTEIFFLGLQLDASRNRIWYISALKYDILATILTIFLRIILPNLMQFKQY